MNNQLWSILVNRMYTFGETFAVAKEYVLTLVEASAKAQADTDMTASTALVTAQAALAPNARTANWYNINTAFAFGGANPAPGGLPDMTGHAGNVLSTDGAVASWATTSSSGVTTVGAFGATPTANAMTIAGANITAQPADATHPGSMTSGTQTIGGAKTFAATPTIALGIIASGVTAGSAGFRFDVNPTLSGQNLFEVTLGGAGPYFWVDNTADTHVFGTLRCGGGVVAGSTIGAVGDIESDTVGGGLIIKSLDGIRWRILVANTTGALTTVLA